MDDMETVTLSIATKCGGKVWPEGEQTVPTGLVGDLRKAGVLVEPRSEQEPEPTPEPSPEPTPAPTPEPTPAPTPEPTPAPTPEPTPEPPVVTPPEVETPPEIEGLTPEQVTLLQNALKGMAGDDLKQDGTPKVTSVNAALKMAEAGFEVKAEQIAAAMPKGDADRE